MRREILPPARPLLPHGGGSALVRLSSTPRERAEGPSRMLDRAALLDPAGDAPERRRRWFHPATGRFRALEREASLWLSRHFWPRVPGLAAIYDRTLQRQLTLSETEIALAGLPRAFEGFRILLVSDLHAGPFVSVAGLRRSLERLMTVEPDAIVLAGDLTTSQLAEWHSHAAAYDVLRARSGVFAVLGNHDHYTEQPERLRELLQRSGIEVLHNRCASIVEGGASLSLAGVDDLLRGRADLDRALAGARGPVILVSHNPDVLFAAARRGVALVLSGHTHGGQVRIPGLPVLVRQSQYRLDEGRYRAGGTELIVSRGLGAVGLPLRIGCPPEGVLIRLAAR